MSSAEQGGIGVLGYGYYVPEKIVTNTDFAAMGIETSDEWIKTRTGISERRIAEANTPTSDLAYSAGKLALENAALTPDDIDLIILATSTPDHLAFPSTACIVQEKLGCKTIPAFDLSAACTGFNYALTMGQNAIHAGTAKKVLVIAADCLSKILDWEDRTTCVLFGDGAGAVVLGKVEANSGVLYSKLHANGGDADILKVPSGGTKNPFTETVLTERSHFITMAGRSVFKSAIQSIIPSVKDALEATGLTAADVTYFIPHQANQRIIAQCQEKCGFTEEQTVSVIDRFGNTSAASIPIALGVVGRQKNFKKGDILLLVGFGAGFTWGVNIIKWSN